MQSPTVIKTSAKYFINHTRDFLMDHAPKQPAVYIVRLKPFFTKYVIINTPNGIDYVMRRNNKNYIKTDFIRHSFFKLALGKSLASLEGDEWKDQRRMLQPSFHKEKIGNFIEKNVIPSIEKFIDHKKTNWTNVTNGISIKKEVDDLVLVTVIDAIFSGMINEEESNYINQSVDYLRNIAYKRFIRRELAYPFHLPILYKREEKKKIFLLHEQIRNIVKERKKSTTEYSDLLDMLLHIEKATTNTLLSEEEIVHEALDMFVGAFGSTTSIVSFLIYELAKQPHIQEKLYQEIKLLKSPEEPLQVKHFHPKTYLEACVNETLRFYATPWVILRKSIQKDELEGYEIPAHTNIYLPLSVMHHQQDIWKDPHVFRPERWLESNLLQELPKGSFVPFSTGPRKCIGDMFAMIQIQATIILLLQQFKLSAIESSIDDYQVSNLIKISPQLKIQVKNRNII